jgi:hypothetical protein
MIALRCAVLTREFAVTKNIWGLLLSKAGLIRRNALGACSRAGSSTSCQEKALNEFHASIDTIT